MNFPQAISAASSTALELGTLKPTDTKVVLETVGEVDVVIRIFTHQKAKVCDIYIYTLGSAPASW